VKEIFLKRLNQCKNRSFWKKKKCNLFYKIHEKLTKLKQFPLKLKEFPKQTHAISKKKSRKIDTKLSASEDQSSPILHKNVTIKPDIRPYIT